MVLLVGVGMFLGAQHAAHYPNSWVGRCARTVYHMWDPMFTPDNGPGPAVAVIHVPKTTPSRKQEVVEPIVIIPTEEEPPLALPRLSPEIVAAIERLRGEEESEAPPRPFDRPSQILHMPYAEEESELLPFPSADPVMPVASMAGCNFLFLPASYWDAMVAKVMDVLNQYAEEQ